MSSFEREFKKYAVVFADIRGFTELFKLHDSEQMEMIVGDWFVTAYEEKIAKFNGFVDKFLGDGMLLLFSGTKDAFDACCALLGLAKKIDEHLNGKLAKGWLGKEFSIGIGLEYGEVVEGKIHWTPRTHFENWRVYQHGFEARGNSKTVGDSGRE